nr:tetratricopeptide repeat protein [Sphingomicrobium sediminis]
MADFGRKWGKWIGGAVFIFLAAVAGFLFWQDQSAKNAEASAEELAKVIADLGNPEESDTLVPRLQEAAGEASGAGKGAIMMAEAAIEIDNANRDRAIEIYAAIAADEDIAKPYRDAALIRQTLLDFDRVEPDVVIARLQPLVNEEEPFYGSAAELTALALIEAEREDEAAQLFKQIAENPDVPRSLRARSVQIAGTYGVDASAALASIEQQDF